MLEEYTTQEASFYVFSSKKVSTVIYTEGGLALFLSQNDKTTNM